MSKEDLDYRLKDGGYALQEIFRGANGERMRLYESPKGKPIVVIGGPESADKSLEFSGQ